MQSFPGRNALLVPPLEFVIMLYQGLLEVGKAVPPVVFGRQFISPAHAAQIVERPVEVPAAVDDFL